MFESLNQNTPEKRELESEKRQMNVVREGNALNSTNEAVLMEALNGKSDLILWQQDLVQGLEVLKNRLRNRFFDVTSQTWLPRIKTMIDREGKPVQVEMLPLLTEEGIAMIENQISPFLGIEAKNMINSNLERERILKMLEDTSNVVCDNLVDYYDTYIVDPSPSNLDNILRIIKNMIIPTAFRARDGWTKIQDNTSIKRVDTFAGTQDNEQKKKFTIF